MHKKLLMGLIAAMLASAPYGMAEEEECEEYEEECEEEIEEVLPKSEVLKFLKKNIPEAVTGLNWIKKHEPAEYEERVIGWGELVLYYRELKEDAPKAAKALLKSERLEFQCGELVDKINDSDDAAAKEKMKKELQTKLGEVFDAKLVLRELEVKELEEEVKEIKTMIKKRKTARAKIIKKRMADMLDEEDEELEWW